MIDLENVSKTYTTARGPVHALKDVTLHVDRGEFVAVRGPSGCGKSTLLLIVGGLARPTAGRVSVAGVSLREMSASARAAFRAEKIGFVFQTFHLLPYLNVLGNVTAAAAGGNRRDAKRRAEETLQRVGLAERRAHRPGELSAGECQRVAVARALINRPQLLLADEPTGNLDRESARVVLDLLSDFHCDGGTVFLVTHDDHAAGFAGRTVHLQQGELLEAETSVST